MSVPADALPGVTAPISPAPGADTPWYASIPDAELRGYAELKKFPDAPAVLKSYRDLEKFTGVPADRLLRIPEKADAPEWGPIRERLGFAAPKTPEDYGFPDIPGAHPEYSKAAAQWAHEAGIPKDMALKLAAKQGEWVQAKEKEYLDSVKMKEQVELQQLKSEWGDRFTASEELGRRAVRELGSVAGLGAEEMNAMEGALGTAKFLKLFAAIGSRGHKEDDMIGAGDSVAKGFGMSPDAAKAKIGMLTQDKEWFKRYNAGDTRALEEWSMLNAIAAGANPQT